ncbi:unnamed protein product [Acanthosepion pharaonis]|uniref:tRNA (34-2'-O)-methyltransferase regulator WDR6 n=1 Tax=Acanthosepion pharaonis TaxID=158019 RepID=A0A812CFU8_ACAPH|nr:unnamed protein product [Sepia pharaonis]
MDENSEIIQLVYQSGPVTTLKVIDDILLAGIGSHLHIYELKTSQRIEVIQTLPHQNIHGISEAPSANDKSSNKLLCIFGGRAFQVVDFDEQAKRISKKCQALEIRDWIWDAQWLKTAQDDSFDCLALVTGHNCIVRINWKSSQLIDRIQCEEQCILYCAHFIGLQWDQLILAAGTVFNQIILWAPTTNRTTNENLIISKPFHRLTGHQGVIFSIHYHEGLKKICSASDDRSIRCVFFLPISFFPVCILSTNLFPPSVYSFYQSLSSQCVFFLPISFFPVCILSTNLFLPSVYSFLPISFFRVCILSTNLFPPSVYSFYQSLSECVFFLPISFFPVYSFYQSLSSQWVFFSSFSPVCILSSPKSVYSFYQSLSSQCVFFLPISFFRVCILSTNLFLPSVYSFYQSLSSQCVFFLPISFFPVCILSTNLFLPSVYSFYQSLFNRKCVFFLPISFFPVCILSTNLFLPSVYSFYQSLSSQCVFFLPISFFRVCILSTNLFLPSVYSFYQSLSSQCVFFLPIFSSQCVFFLPISFLPVCILSTNLFLPSVYSFLPISSLPSVYSFTISFFPVCILSTNLVLPQCVFFLPISFLRVCILFYQSLSSECVFFLPISFFPVCILFLPISFSSECVFFLPISFFPVCILSTNLFPPSVYSFTNLFLPSVYSFFYQSLSSQCVFFLPISLSSQCVFFLLISFLRVCILSPISFFPVCILSTNLFLPSVYSFYQSLSSQCVFFLPISFFPVCILFVWGTNLFLPSVYSFYQSLSSQCVFFLPISFFPVCILSTNLVLPSVYSFYQSLSSECVFFLPISFLRVCILSTNLFPPSVYSFYQSLSSESVSQCILSTNLFPPSVYSFYQSLSSECILFYQSLFPSECVFFLPISFLRVCILSTNLFPPSVYSFYQSLSSQCVFFLPISFLRVCILSTNLVLPSVYSFYQSLSSECVFFLPISFFPVCILSTNLFPPSVYSFYQSRSSQYVFFLPISFLRVCILSTNLFPPSVYSFYQSLSSSVYSFYQSFPPNCVFFSPIFFLPNLCILLAPISFLRVCILSTNLFPPSVYSFYQSLSSQCVFFFYQSLSSCVYSFYQSLSSQCVFFLPIFFPLSVYSFHQSLSSQCVFFLPISFFPVCILSTNLFLPSVYSFYQSLSSECVFFLPISFFPVCILSTNLTSQCVFFLSFPPSVYSFYQSLFFPVCILSTNLFPPSVYSFYQSLSSPKCILFHFQSLFLPVCILSTNLFLPSVYSFYQSLSSECVFFLPISFFPVCILSTNLFLPSVYSFYQSLSSQCVFFLPISFFPVCILSTNLFLPSVYSFYQSLSSECVFFLPISFLRVCILFDQSLSSESVYSFYQSLSSRVCILSTNLFLPSVYSFYQSLSSQCILSTNLVLPSVYSFYQSLSSECVFFLPISFFPVCILSTNLFPPSVYSFYQSLSSQCDATCCIWDHEGKIRQKFKGHKGKSIWSMAISKKEDLVVTGGGDSSIRAWSVHLDLCAKHVTSKQLEITHLEPEAKTPNFPRSVTYLNFNTILVMTNSGNLYQYCLIHSSWANLILWTIPILFQPSGQKSDDVCLCTCKYINCDFPNYYDGKVFNLLWIDDIYLFTTGPEGLMRLSILNSKGSSLGLEQLHQFILPQSKQRWATTACFYPAEEAEKESLVCGDRNGSVHLYSLRQDSQQVSTPTQSFYRIHGKSGVTDVRSRKGFLFTAGRDGQYRQFNSSEDNSLQLLNSKKVFKGFEWLDQLHFNDEDDLLILGFHSVTRGVVICEAQIPSNQKVLKPSHHGRQQTNVKHLFSRIDSKGQIHHVCITCSDDTTVQVVELSNDHAKKMDLKVLLVLPGHISSVQTITCLKTLTPPCWENGQSYLLFSAGGRAQFNCCRLTFLAPNNQDDDQTTVCIPEQLCREFLVKRIPKHWATKNLTVDPETRIMDVTAFHGQSVDPNFPQNIVFVGMACSDGSVRVFSFNEESRKLHCLWQSSAFSNCVLQVTHFVHSSNNTVPCRIFLLSAATDGYIYFWEITSICRSQLVTDSREIPCAPENETFNDFATVEADSLEILGNASTDNAEESHDRKRVGTLLTNGLSSDCKEESDFNISANMSGINSLHIKQFPDGSLILGSGGDDNAFFVTSFLLSPPDSTKEDKLINCQFSLKNQFGHAAQITGIHIINKEFIVTSSIDQRICLWHLQLCDAEKKYVCVLCRYVEVADLSSMAVWIYSNHLYIAVCGAGLCVLSINLQYFDGGNTDRENGFLMTPLTNTHLLRCP